MKLFNIVNALAQTASTGEEYSKAVSFLKEHIEELVPEKRTELLARLDNLEPSARRAFDAKLFKRCVRQGRKELGRSWKNPLTHPTVPPCRIRGI